MNLFGWIRRYHLDDIGRDPMAALIIPWLFLFRSWRNAKNSSFRPAQLMPRKRQFLGGGKQIALFA
jgi:hypothetical protein